MVAESRNIDAGDFARLKNGHSLRYLNGIAVDEDLNGVVGVGEMDAGAGERRPRREIGGRRLLGGGGSGFGIAKLGFGDDGSEEECARVLGTEEEPRGGSHGLRS